MTKLDFVDVTLRDGHQSLWATRMTAGMFAPIIGRMDEIGFKAIDFTGAMHLDVQVRYLREDPWERIRLAKELAPRTPLNSWMRPRNMISFEIMANDVITLWIQRLAANGISRLTAGDPLFDLKNMRVIIQAAKEAGIEFVAALQFSLSPVHTDELFVDTTKALLEAGADVILLKDPSALMTPDRVRTLVPALQSVLDGHPLEVHFHCLTGLAPVSYFEAMRLGVDAVQTAISPLANGASLPATEQIAGFAAQAGRQAELDASGITEMAAHFHAVAERTGKPVGQLAEFDPRQYEHQLPGGMISNLQSQLAEIGLEDRLDEVLDEAARVREDLGYLNVVTPFAQMVGTQAVINVVQGDRFATVPDEIVRYALGYYGTPLAPIEPDVLDRILSAPAARDAESEPGDLPPMLPEARKRLGKSLSDDELLLRIGIPEQYVDDMIEAGPLTPSRLSIATPLPELIKEFVDKRSLAYVHVETDEYKVTVRKSPKPQTGPDVEKTS